MNYKINWFHILASTSGSNLFIKPICFFLESSLRHCIMSCRHCSCNVFFLSTHNTNIKLMLENRK